MNQSRSDIFADVGPELDSWQHAREVRKARRAAVRAQESLTLTARRQYHHYREAAGDEFLAWPEWHTHYLAKYRAHLSVPPGNEFSSM